MTNKWALRSILADIARRKTEGKKLIDEQKKIDFFVKKIYPDHIVQYKIIARHV